MQGCESFFVNALWCETDICNAVRSDCKVIFVNTMVPNWHLQCKGKLRGTRLQGPFFNTLVRNCTLQCNHPLGSYNIIRGDCKLHSAPVELNGNTNPLSLVLGPRPQMGILLHGGFSIELWKIGITFFTGKRTRKECIPLRCRMCAPRMLSKLYKSEKRQRCPINHTELKSVRYAQVGILRRLHAEPWGGRKNTKKCIAACAAIDFAHPCEKSLFQSGRAILKALPHETPVLYKLQMYVQSDSVGFPQQNWHFVYVTNHFVHAVKQKYKVSLKALSHETPVLRISPRLAYI